MKRISKILFSIFSVASVMALVSAPETYAEKVELATDAIRIDGVGQQTKGDASFRPDGREMPKKIRVTELSITYDGKGDKKLLEIVEEGGDTLYSHEVTNFLIPNELIVRLYLKGDKNYIITHGDKEWKLNFVRAKPVQPEVPNSVISSMAKKVGIPQWRIDEGFKIPEGANEKQILDNLKLVADDIRNNAKSNMPWWIYLAIGILILGIVYLLLPKLKRILFHKKAPKGASRQPRIPVNKDGSNGNDNSSTEVDEKSSGIDKDAELKSIRDAIDSLLGDYNIDLTNEQKIARIKISLDSGRGAEDVLRQVRHALDIKDGNRAQLLRRIKELKDSASIVSQDDRRKVSDELIEKLLGKKDKNLKNIIAKAKEEGGDNPYEVILKVLNLMSSKIGRENPVASDKPTLEKYLEDNTNECILRGWLYKKFDEAGIAIDDKNKTIAYNLSQLASNLNSSQQEASRKSEAEIVDGVILEDKLTDEQKKVLVRRLIDKINEKIQDSSKSITGRLSHDEFVQKIAEALQQPSAHEEAQPQQSSPVREDEVSNPEQTSLSKLLQKFNVDKLEDLPKAIKEKQDSVLINSVADKVSELLPGQRIGSVQRLVNNLLKEVKDVRKNSDSIAADLEKEILTKDKSYIPSGDNGDVRGLMKTYSGLVKKEEESLHAQITSKDNKISELQGDIANKTAAMASLENYNRNLMAESMALVEDLHAGAEKIRVSRKPILNPCSDDEEEQCADIEGRLYSDLESSVKKLETFNVSDETVPAKTRKEIQELLIKEVSSDASPINTVCRYYAYSRLPFMTDKAREYGITFNRRNMAELYIAIENLYVRFGINFDIPALFVMGMEEGEFEDVTGQAYGDLDNLCQNSRNHYDNIDSATKPANVIVDIVNVGYSVDGEVGRKTSVLTY